ncbi:hypothetical protein [Microbispora bryophytorum]|uniref:hypothetical protein n=1 Tax=Microbispora bryophytorum TaxID=1460882 RepID=UPI0033DF3ACF
MGELASYLVEEAYDEEGTWMVVDETVATGKETAPWEQEWQGQGDWVEVGPNALVCQTHRDVRPYVRLELWSGEPPLAEPAWDCSWTAEIFLRSGKIRLMGFYSGTESHRRLLDLGHRDSTWLVRAQHKTLENDRETDFPRYIYRAEIYKFQFWRPIRLAGR